MTKLKTNDFSLAFFENGKEIESAPGRGTTLYVRVPL